MLNLVLYRPQMPANAGNAMRLAVNLGCRLHFIGPLCFFLDDRRLRRAGLDYAEVANLTVHPSLEDFLRQERPARLIAATAHGQVHCHEFSFREGDAIIFGQETSGLPAEILGSIPEGRRLRIPMAPGSRCINLSNSVAIMAYEAWRQLHFQGAAPTLI
ncbi:MAG: tRNA (cytidine(34)-2'-O)-methyltransferase [Succinivibrionaceae bacterium]|nr:tRNA (cytidine(34)-2'-O)-methyltransferase [Succinivibrionaceae bacterium]